MDPLESQLLKQIKDNQKRELQKRLWKLFTMAILIISWLIIEYPFKEETSFLIFITIGILIFTMRVPGVTSTPSDNSMANQAAAESNAINAYTGVGLN